MSEHAAIDVSDVVHRYGDRIALAGLNLRVEPGELFALLGPNGGGKTTLFRLISTLIPIQQGTIRVFDANLQTESDRARQSMGIVFQAPSLDKKLSIAENLQHQGHLYGMRGRQLAARIDELLSGFRLADRARDLVETLSGGLRRRVELAKGLLHGPRLLLLDEPSTGLDPGVRSDLWEMFRTLQRRDGVTIVLTTHLLEEADKADRLAILHTGNLVALDTPDRLRATVGGDTLTLEADDPAALADAIRQTLNLQARVVDGAVRLEDPAAHQLVARLVEAFPGQIRSVTLGKPTLEDVFIQRTGHRFATADQEVAHA